MADFSGTQNLLAYKGAKLLTNIDPQRPQMAYVCIPVDYNDIQLSRDGKYANAAVYIQETNDRFRQACIQRRQMAGDPVEGYNPPSHQMEASFSKEFRQRALEAAKRRIISEHPEWQSNPELQNPELNKDLRNAMYDACRIRLASLYAHVRQQHGYQQQPAYQQSAYGQAFSGQPQQWQQPADNSYEQPDDLPF